MNSYPPVPLVDLSLQHERIAADVSIGFERVLKSTSFVLGPEVQAFEQSFAEYCDVDHAVGVGNGTDALEIALVAAGVRRGDEVIVPANTFVATAEAVVRIGATLVLADCDEHFLIDPADVAHRITSRTRAVIAVHLYGQTAPIEVLRAVVGPDIVIVEDAAQSQGARRHGARAGSLGDIAGTSFYPGKNLGAYGDGGALMTNCEEYADLARKLRNHGGARKYEHVEIGRNSRLDGLQAVVLSTKLDLLDAWNDERRAAAARYDQLLAGLDQVATPLTLPGNEHVFHLYVVRLEERDRVLAELNDAGIGAGIHYPHPIHRLAAFDSLDLGAGGFPRSERFAEEILSLPIFPGITEAQQNVVIASLRKALR